MFQQIVYTRCKPRRELLNVSNNRLSDGKVVNEEGFAIHNFSEGILSEECLYDPLYLEILMKKKNAAKEMGSNATGTFASYEYFCNENGGSFLGHEYLRPYNAADVRTNGQKHRPGNYIKQYLVGEFNNYPCLFFGGDCWTAHKEVENYYYHDNDEPLTYLPPVDESSVTYLMTRAKVKEFIENRREECVKKLVAIVISEMSKNIENRKFVVIKDTPQNVELWIAAVEFSLPVYLAKQISFSTNIVASQNLSVDNIYYVDENNRFIKGNQKDAREEGRKKRYYSMIVGIHPIAQGSAGITFGMNNANFVLLDGESKSIEDVDNTMITRAYFNAVALMDEDIKNFDKLLGELKQVKFGSNSTDLYELFDGYKYLLDSVSNTENWEFTKVGKYLSMFKKYESVPYKWSQYLAEKVYDVYSNFYESDVKDNFSLLKLIISMDHDLKLQNGIEQFLVNKYLYKIKTQNIDVTAAIGLNKLINTVYLNIPQLVANGVKNNIMTFIDIADMWNPEQSYYMFTKLFESNNMVGRTNLEWYKEELNNRLISTLFENICQSDKSTFDLLMYVKNTPIYLEIVVNGAKKDFDKWSKYVCDSVVDSKLEMVCGAMLDIDTVNATQYENFLVMLLRAGKQTSILFKFIIKANEKFGITDESAIKFVSAYLNIYGKRAIELKALVDLMSENDLGSEAEELAYDKINEFITVGAVDNPMKVLAKEFEMWRLGLKKPQGRAYVITFSNVLSGQPLEKALEILDRYIVKEPLIVNEMDMKMIISALASNLSNAEIYVKIYHLLQQNHENVRKQLFNVDFEDVESVKWYLRLFLKRSFDDWAIDYIDDIKSIEKEIYVLIKKENLDKLEKSILKSLEKDSLDIDMFKNYFDKVKNQIKEDKVEEKQKAKETKKERKKEADSSSDENEKKGIFSKFFGKKYKDE